MSLRLQMYELSLMQPSFFLYFPLIGRFSIEKGDIQARYEVFMLFRSNGCYV